MIEEGLELIDKAMHHRSPGPYQLQAAIPQRCMRWRKIRRRPTGGRSTFFYATLEHLQPLAVVTLNRAVAVDKVRGPQAALAMIEPLAPRLNGYFHFFGVKGALLLKLGRRQEAQAAFDRAIALANTRRSSAYPAHLDRLIRNSEAPRA